MQGGPPGRGGGVYARASVGLSLSLSLSLSLLLRISVQHKTIVSQLALQQSYGFAQGVNVRELKTTKSLSSSILCGGG